MSEVSYKALDGQCAGGVSVAPSLQTGHCQSWRKHSAGQSRRTEKAMLLGEAVFVEDVDGVPRMLLVALVRVEPEGQGSQVTMKPTWGAYLCCLGVRKTFGDPKKHR